MDLHYDLHLRPPSSQWLERIRHFGHRAHQQGEEMRTPEPVLIGQTSDQQETWTTGYDAFWRDLVATWLVALLLVGAILAFQTATRPRPDPTAGASISLAPSNAASDGRQGDDDAAECSDLDYAYLRC